MLLSSVWGNKVKGKCVKPPTISKKSIGTIIGVYKLYFYNIPNNLDNRSNWPVIISIELLPYTVLNSTNKKKGGYCLWLKEKLQKKRLKMKK